MKVPVVYQTYRSETPAKAVKPYGSIYVITCKITGKQYVGQTTRTVKHRWHNPAVAYRGCRLLENAIRKYGEDQFTVCVIATADNQSDLDVKEAYYILKLGTLKPNGYNLKVGGKGKGINSPETIGRMRLSATRSEAARRHRQALTDSQRGVPRHPGHIKPWLDRMRQLWKDPEYCRKLGASLKKSLKMHAAWVASRGRVMSPESRAKLSAAKKGIPWTAERRAKMQPMYDARVGKPMPPGTGAKISEALKGRTFSAEHRRNLSLAMKRRFQEKGALGR